MAARVTNVWRPRRRYRAARRALYFAACVFGVLALWAGWLYCVWVLDGLLRNG